MGTAPILTGAGYRNVILQHLSPDEIARIRPHLTRMRMVNGQVLYEAGSPVDRLYFVEQGFVSMVAEADDGGPGVEVGVIGRESVVGLTALLAPRIETYSRAMVQLPGVAYSLPVAMIIDGLDRMPGLRSALMRALALLIAQITQTAACNGRHLLPKRLARWLLISHDRVDGDELLLTQEFLAIMLAVRRSGVTLAIQALAATGAISHSRGRVVVRDRPALESMACPCYGRVQRFSADAPKADTDGVGIVGSRTDLSSVPNIRDVKRSF